MMAALAAMRKGEMVLKVATPEGCAAIWKSGGTGEV